MRLTSAPERAVRVAAACAALAILAGLGAAWFAHGGSLDPRAMINLAGTDPLARLVRAGDPSFPLVTPAQHYDGVYYYAIARDPLITGHAHALIDQAAYRYGHPLHGWLAALLAGGRPAAIPAALFALSLLGLGAAGWLASRLAAALGASPWLGLAVAASPGLLYATTVSTTETVGAALVLGWQRGQLGPSYVLMTLACLDKEQYVSVPVGLALWELTRPRSSRTARLAGLAATPVPLALWYVYVHARLHRWPFAYDPGNLGRPLAGWLETFRDAHQLGGGSFEQSEIGTVVAPMLIALAVLLLGAALRAAWLRSNPLHGPLVLLVLITSCQGWRTLLYPHELVRTPAVAVLLAVLVLLVPARSPGPTRSHPARARAVASPRTPVR